jgi:hypothetical protein
MLYLQEDAIVNVKTDGVFSSEAAAIKKTKRCILLNVITAVWADDKRFDPTPEGCHQGSQIVIIGQHIVHILSHSSTPSTSIAAIRWRNYFFPNSLFQLSCARTDSSGRRVLPRCPVSR